MVATFWMIGALASFCLMAIGARELSGAISTFEVLFFRSLIGLFVVVGLLMISKNTAALASQKLGKHIFRNLFHFAGQYGWFIGIGLLPFAEVFALEFTVSIWTLIIAILFLKETLTARKVIALILGLLGVVVIVRPGYEIIDVASFVVLGSALCFAIAHTTTKSLASTEKPMTILFYMCIVQLPIGLIFALFEWRWPTSFQWVWITVIGLAALTAHFCMTKAMQHAEVTTVITLDFLRLPLIALVGVLFYGEALELALLLGGAIMLASNLVSLYKKG